MRQVFVLTLCFLMGSVTLAQATTVKEMRLMCRDYQKNNYAVSTKPHAYCAGYFQAQIQSAEALCKTMRILHQKKPEHRAMIMGTSSLFASSATAADYRLVISAFIEWAQKSENFDDKNPSIYLNEYLPKNWPCDPAKPIETASE